jgi:hypothetical protein
VRHCVPVAYIQRMRDDRAVHVLPTATTHVGSPVARPTAAGIQPADTPLPPPAPHVTGPDLPAISPRHPALPAPPSLAELVRLAASAPHDERFVPGSHPSTIRNAHYANTRSQLAFALSGPYNSVEGDVRVRNGLAVMQHDARGRADLTFEQWAVLAAHAGKHLRIDIKEPTALDHVTRTLRQHGIPDGQVTFNVAIDTSWRHGLTLDRVRALRSDFPASWITINLPLPLGPGYLLAARAARAIGGERLGVAVVAGLVRRADVALLRRTFAAVNAWNIPQLGDINVTDTTAHLRHIGVNGMIDLRRKNDPLASA